MGHLPLSQNLEILHAYLEALYEVRDNVRLVEKSPFMIAAALSEEIPVTLGRAYYRDALYWKAIGLMHLMKYDESQHILWELIRMKPRRMEYRKKLFRCLFFDKPSWNRVLKAISIVLFFSAAIVILFEILIVDAFYHQYIGIFTVARSTMFIGALVAWGSAEMIHAVKCWVGVYGK